MTNALQELVESLLSPTGIIDNKSQKRYNNGVLRASYLANLWMRGFPDRELNEPPLDYLFRSIDEYVTIIMGSKASIVMDYKGIFLFKDNPYFFIPNKLFDSKEYELAIRVNSKPEAYFKHVDQRITLPRYHHTLSKVFISDESRLTMVEWVLIHGILSKCIKIGLESSDND